MEIGSTVLWYIAGGLASGGAWVLNQLYQAFRTLNHRLDDMSTTDETRQMIMDMMKPLDLRQDILEQNLDKIDQKLDTVIAHLMKTPKARINRSKKK